MIFKVAAVLLVIAALLSCLIPGLHELGEVKGQYLYFYEGNLILCSSECFLEGGELMDLKNPWGTNSIASIGVVLLAGVLAAILWMLSAICKAISNALNR